MALFPGSLPVAGTADPADTLAAAGHTSLHNTDRDEIRAIATKVGTGSATPASGLVLRGNGAGTSHWSQVVLTSDVSGILPVANGGTGTTSTTGTGSVVYSISPTLTTPVLTTPTIANFTNATHDHSNNANGGTLGASTVGTTQLADSSVTPAKLDAGLQQSWNVGTLPAVSSVTNNGQRSYDITFASTVASYLTPGMRLRATRTVTAPTQCADLEAGSSQYFSKTNATGFSTGTTWTFKAKIKPESYSVGVIASLDDGTNIIQMYLNSTGNIVINGGLVSSPDSVTSYQTVQLGVWQEISGSITVGTPTGEIRINDKIVPSFVTASASTTVTISGDETFSIGRNVAGNYFDGKIAQVAIFNAIISDSTLATYSGQLMTGSEPNCKGYWSLNNTLNDSSASGNNLIAGGSAVATNTDSPFGTDGNGTSGGTYEFGIVTKVSTTTATVQVPEGCAIPTSGGISAVDYSSDSVPFGFPKDEGRWVLSQTYKVQTTTTSSATFVTHNSGGFSLTVPVGSWTVGAVLPMYASATVKTTFNLSPTSIVGVAVGSEDLNWSAGIIPTAAATNLCGITTLEGYQNLTSSQTYVLYHAGATTGNGLDCDNQKCELYAKFGLL